MISIGAKTDLRHGNISIGNYVPIPHGCVIFSYDVSSEKIDSRDYGSGSIRIEDNLFISANSVVLRKVVIGENTIVGAGSVVSNRLPPNVITVDSPVAVIREWSELSL
jgi:galactoside O-acetyltransferase